MTGGMQGPPAAEMLGHLLWGELNLSPNFSTRELVSGQALATPGRERKGLPGTARLCVCSVCVCRAQPRGRLCSL